MPVRFASDPPEGGIVTFFYGNDGGFTTDSIERVPEGMTVSAAAIQAKGWRFNRWVYSYYVRPYSQEPEVTKFVYAQEIAFIADIHKDIVADFRHPGSWGPSWSSSTAKIAFISDRDWFDSADFLSHEDLYLMNADGSNPQRLTSIGMAIEPLPFSPDGAYLVFGSTAGDYVNLFVVETASGAVANLTNSGSNDTEPVWSSGDMIAFVSDRDGTPGIYVIDMAPYPAISAPAPVSGAGESSAPAWSPDGNKLLFTSVVNDQTDLFVYDTQTDTTATLTSSSEVETRGGWSPDGSHVAFTSSRYYHSVLFVMDASGVGSAIRQITDPDGDVESFSWSPDGSRISFVSDKTGNPDIYVADADGANCRNVTNWPNEDSSPIWVGTDTLVFISLRGAILDLFSLELASGDLSNLTGGE